MYSQLVITPTTLDFGDQQRGYYLSKLSYEVTNNSTDIAYITYAHSASAFVNENVWTEINPGQTISNFVKLDRSFAEGQYTENLYLETSLGNVSIEVSANIIDDTPTMTFNDIYYWVGTGNNRAILEIDFNDGLEKEAVAFGYKFSGTAPASQMLTDIANAFPQLTIDAPGGFISTITFDNHTGVGGSPLNWMTLSRQSNSLWETNWGITTLVDNGEWYGCTYTDYDADYNPLNLPENPYWAGYPLSVSEIAEANFDIFPNPASDNICIETKGSNIKTIQIVDLSGKIIKSIEITSGTNKNWLNISNLANGVYQLNIYTDNSFESRSLIKN